MEVRVFQQTFNRLAEAIEEYLIGKRSAVESALICLLARGHLLVEDYPGLGKTLLAGCLAGSIKDASVHRIQFTPDLLPTDVTGTNIYLQNEGVFEFRHGPVFANVVLADEINRASPRTQSALLEVMEEGQVTFDGEPHDVPQPFMVIATQNPAGAEGTYTLPEAQLDRFLMRIHIGYPDRRAERLILDKNRRTTDASGLVPGIGEGEFDTLARVPSDHVEVIPDVRDYVLEIVEATRSMAAFPGTGSPGRDLGNGGPPPLLLGASPRGSLALIRAARVRAASRGRDHVVPEDVKALAVSVLAHRLVLRHSGVYAGPGTDAQTIISGIVDRVRVPV